MKTVILAILVPIINSVAQTNINNVDSILNKYNQQSSPGFCVGIVKNDSIIYNRSFGLANLEYHIPNSDSSIFSIASISKQFTSACLWTLVKEKRISLEDDIRKYLPEFPFYGDTLKIKHLLNHTSGIRNYHTLMDLSGFDYDKEYYDNNTVFKIACRQEHLNNRPGEKFYYGNTAYNIIAMIIEKVSNQHLHQYAYNNIFKPFGMHTAVIRTENNSIIKNRSVGYVYQQSEYIQFPKTQCSYGSGSMGASIKDLAKWSVIFTNCPKEFEDLRNFLIHRDILISGDTNTYARGVIIDNYKGLKTIHHSGFATGSKSQIISIPTLSLSIIILSNVNTIDPTNLSYELLNCFINTKSINKKGSNTYQITKKELNTYAGFYQEINSDMMFEFIIENDSLKARNLNNNKFISLVAIEKYKFSRLNNSSVNYSFATKNNSEYDLTISFGGTPFYFNKINVPQTKIIHLDEYLGKYYSKELDTEYTIIKENENLILSYNSNRANLYSINDDQFGNRQRVLYQFKRNENGIIQSCLVSADGSIKEIKFIKLPK